MPAKSKSKSKKGSRKPYKKSGYTRGGSGTTVALKTLTAPDRLIVKLPYYDQFTVNQTAGHVRDFNLNSIYDPDRSGVGHQPLGYDQWATFFNRYRVFGVKMVVSMTNLGTVPVRFGIIGNNQQGVAIGTPQAVWESQHVKSKQIGTVQGMNNQTITKYFHLPRITGATNIMYKGSAQYAAQFGANPSELIIGHLVAIPATTSFATDVVNVSYDVRIIFMCELYDRNQLSLSNTNAANRGPANNLLEPVVVAADTTSTWLEARPEQGV